MTTATSSTARLTKARQPCRPAWATSATACSSAERLGQAPLELVAAQLDRAEAMRVVGRRLDVAELEAGGGELLERSDQQHVARVRDRVEHRLQEGRAAERDADHARRELIAGPDLERVRQAGLVQQRVLLGDPWLQPDAVGGG